MTDDFDAEGYVATMAGVIGLTIDPDWMPTVVANVRATWAIATLVLDFPLDVHVEPAGGFEA